MPVEAVAALEAKDFQVAKPIKTEDGDSAWASYKTVQIPIVPPAQAPQVQQRSRKENLRDRLARLENELTEMRRGRFRFGTRQEESEE